MEKGDRVICIDKESDMYLHTYTAGSMNDHYVMIYRISNGGQFSDYIRIFDKDKFKVVPNKVEVNTNYSIF